MVIELANLLVILFYILSTAGYISFLFVQKKRFREVALYAMVAGFCCHTLVLTTDCIRAGYLPVSNLQETLSIVSWSTALVFLFLRYRYGMKILGMYAAPIAACAMVASTGVPGAPAETDGIFRSFWFVAHIITVFAGEAALALAFGAGLLYLLQEHAIKEKKRGFFYRRLPSLEQLDNTGYRCIITGFAALTIGLVTGMIYAKQVWHRFAGWDPKEIWSGISWLVYAALLHERIVAGWRGRRAAVMAIVGFLVLLFTFFGVNFLMDGHHGEFTRW